MSHAPSHDDGSVNVEDCMHEMGKRIRSLEERVEELQDDNGRTMPFIRSKMPIGGRW